MCELNSVRFHAANIGVLVSDKQPPLQNLRFAPIKFGESLLAYFLKSKINDGGFYKIKSECARKSTGLQNLMLKKNCEFHGINFSISNQFPAKSAKFLKCIPQLQRGQQHEMSFIMLIKRSWRV